MFLLRINKMNSSEHVYKWAISILVVIVAVAIVWLFLPRFKTIREQQRHKAALEIENRNIEQETKELRIKRERFKTEPEFIESVARKSGRVKADEVIFKFIPPQDKETE